MKAGLYLAIVTDNKNFYNTGTIKVRIKDFYNDQIKFLHLYQQQEDLSSRNDMDAYVFSPTGQGAGHGYFSLPSINEMGVISFFEGKTDYPVWMGSISLPETYANGTTKNVYVPNENPETNSAYATMDQIQTTDLGDHGFIHRIKEGLFDKSKTINSVDWSRRETKHFFAATKSKYHIRHYTKWKKKVQQNIDNTEFPDSPEQFQEIIVGDSGLVLRIKKNLEDNSGSNNAVVTLDEKGITLTVLNGDQSKANSSRIRIRSNGTVDIKAIDDQKNEMEIKMQEIGLTITRKDATDKEQNITIDADGIKLSSERIKLDAKNIVVGDEGLYLVGTKSFIPLITEDGGTLLPINGFNHDSEFKV